MKQQTCLVLQEFAFGNANSTLVTKGRKHLGFTLAAETTETPKERGNKPKYKQTFDILNNTVISRAA